MSFATSDVRAIAVLVRDRDAWKALALQAIGVLEARGAVDQPALGQHDAQLDAFEKSLIERVLQRTGGNVLQSAAQLGISRPRLHDRIRALGVVVPGRLHVVARGEVAGV